MRLENPRRVGGAKGLSNVQLEVASQLGRIPLSLKSSASAMVSGRVDT